MFNFLKKQKPVEVCIKKCSKTIVIFPCVLEFIKDGLEQHVYQMVGYVNNGNSVEFMYLERRHGLQSNYCVNSFNIPMHIFDKLINQGSLKTEKHFYTLKKL